MAMKYSPQAVMLAAGALLSLQVCAAPSQTFPPASSGIPAATSTSIASTTSTETPGTAATSVTDKAETDKSTPRIAPPNASEQHHVAITTAVSVPATTPPSPESEAAVVPAQTSETPDNNVASAHAMTPAIVLPFTPDQEARIGEVAKAYLLDHPEVLLEVSQKLQIQQREQQVHTMTAAVLMHQDALLNDPSTPTYGPGDAKVALVEFFDYQCSVCAHQAPVIETLMQANPQVRYVFKEWPIFGARWPVSMEAAEKGLQIWDQNGAEAYLAYHNAVFATDHNEGKLTQQDISRASSKAGKFKGKKEEMLDILAQTDALAHNLGLQGTPGLIVMPISGATADNVTVMPGGANLEMLQSAINKAAGQ